MCLPDKGDGARVNKKYKGLLSLALGVLLLVAAVSWGYNQMLTRKAVRLAAGAAGRCRVTAR